MIKIENVEVFGWKAAIRGMRNPMNSWDKSDSKTRLCCIRGIYEYCHMCAYICDGCNPLAGQREFIVGENDLTLMKKLCKGGADDRKFLRMIHVQLDVVAPLYWWKEFDTYKVGTVANSCSTMHKIHAKKFEREDFSIDHLIPRMKEVLDVTIANLNACRGNYLETNDKKWWWQMIQLLPSSYNQRRTIDLNYEVLRNTYHARKVHKLDEWRNFCEWVKTLPYAAELIVGDEG